MPASGLRFGGLDVNFGKTLAIAVTVLVLGAIVLLETPSEDAESTALRLTLNQLRAALVVKGAEIRLTDGEADYAAWTGANPMALLNTPVRNYEGACQGNKPATGRWCFDTKLQQGVLNYQASQPINWEQGEDKRSGTLTWRVEPEYTDLNGNGRLDETDRQTGLKLVLKDSHSDPA
ncbi:hypothetical protein [Marinobacter fonticola]|uniref:hypothetical protein n=1 Tax=Marinobacter fonticola TaxID=2603215 RepID=UPI0011E85CC6|nr:hypothetical protein [Marinobacter fonticola]